MKKYILPFLALILILHDAIVGQYVHPKLRDSEKVIQTIFILQPKVEIQKLGMRGAESMLKESDDCGAALRALVSNVLKERGLQVLESLPLSREGQTGEGIKYAVADVQSLYDRIEPVLNKKPKDVRNGRFSLGSEVAKLDPRAASDAFVLIRAYGTKLTKGKKWFDLFVPTGSPWSSMLVSIAIIDSRTGDVLLFAKLKSVGDPVADHILAKRIQKSLSDFNITSQKHESR